MAGFEQKKTAAIRCIAAGFLSLLVASCGGSGDSGRVSYDGPPRSQDDICAIFAERPGWRDATQAAALKWGAPIEVQMAIMWRESSFRAEARPPKRYFAGVIPQGRASSAYGYAQAIDGTWAWYQRDTGNRRGDRNDFHDASDFVGWYMAKTNRSNGIGMFDAFNQYLNYHEGHAGFRSERWREKDWLQRAATQVAKQAARYRGQLRGC